mmetsp:Transcript_41635/g.63560  ORF Transcript_41635/g.63560 Transcript_41635/m.63560 type:complete len:212 (-) Transcript_41635:1190-1825(-)
MVLLVVFPGADLNGVFLRGVTGKGLTWEVGIGDIGVVDHKHALQSRLAFLFLQLVARRRGRVLFGRATSSLSWLWALVRRLLVLFESASNLVQETLDFILRILNSHIDPLHVEIQRLPLLLGDADASSEAVDVREVFHEQLVGAIENAVVTVEPVLYHAALGVNILEHGISVLLGASSVSGHLDPLAQLFELSHEVVKVGSVVNIEAASRF